MRSSTLDSSSSPCLTSSSPCCAPWDRENAANTSTMSTTGELPPDVNRGPEILAVCGSLCGLALLTVVLRIWVRASMIKHVGWDDWVMVAAMVRSPGLNATIDLAHLTDSASRPSCSPR